MPPLEPKLAGAHPDVDLHGLGPAGLDRPCFSPGFPLLVAGRKGQGESNRDYEKERGFDRHFCCLHDSIYEFR